MKARNGHFCPIHRSFFCCGRKIPARRSGPLPKRPRYAEPVSGKWTEVKPGEWHILDEHHPRGYRVRLSKSRMEHLLLGKVAEQAGCCCICGKRFESLSEVTPDHKEPSSMGGSWRDDHPDNIGAAHRACNFEKGSRRIA